MEKAKQQHQAELSRVQEELSKLQMEKAETEKALRSQIGESERVKSKGLDDLKTAKRKAELAEKKLECKLL